MLRRWYHCCGRTYKNLNKPYVLFGLVLLLICILQFLNVHERRQSTRLVSSNCTNSNSWKVQTDRLSRNISTMLGSNNDTKSRGYLVLHDNKEPHFENEQNMNSTVARKFFNASFNRYLPDGREFPKHPNHGSIVFVKNAPRQWNDLYAKDRLDLAANQRLWNRPCRNCSSNAVRGREDLPFQQPAINRALLRNDTCDGCFKHEFQYVISGQSICKGDTDIELMIVFTTTHGHFKRRNSIRKGLADASTTTKYRYAFLLGESRDQKLTSLVHAEQELHGDIIMEDFVDAYLNLTYKTVMGIRWATSMCSNARYLMKTDDDMFINVPVLLDLLNTSEIQKRLKTSIIGRCWKAKPIRNRRSKYYASYESYPHVYYPDICSGTGYVMSMHVARQINRISANIPFFHLEDVYIGLCLKELGLRTLNNRRFSLRMNMSKKRLCHFRRKYIVSVHAINDSQHNFLWNPDNCLE